MALKQIYVLASHEPNLDPRIDWVARFAANLFQVTVYGMKDSARPGPASDTRNGYLIERLARSFEGMAAFAWSLCRCLATEPFFWLLLFQFAILTPIFVTPWVIIKSLKVVKSILILARSMGAWVLPRTVKRWLRCIMPEWKLRISVTLPAQLARAVWISRHFLTTSITLFRGLQNSSRPDLIYCNDLDTLLASVVLKWRFGCKLVYDAHEFWAHSDPASPWWEIKFFLWYEKNLLRRVDAAFTVNHLLAEQMQTSLRHPFLSLPNCEPLTPATASQIRRLEVLQAAKPQRESVQALARGRVRFLFQGQFAPERGILEFLRVWSRVSPEKAVLFLRGPDNEHKGPCVKLAKELGILDNSVFFLEPILENELVAAASEVDVGIIPYKPITINYRYCCPNKLSQYMQAGLAILANNLDFVKSTIDSYQCGLTYCVEDHELTLAAINRLIDDEPFRRACQKQARTMVFKEFNWEEQSRVLYDLCARLVDLKISTPEDQQLAGRVA